MIRDLLIAFFGFGNSDAAVVVTSAVMIFGGMLGFRYIIGNLKDTAEGANLGSLVGILFGMFVALVIALFIIAEV